MKKNDRVNLVIKGIRYSGTISGLPEAVIKFLNLPGNRTVYYGDPGFELEEKMPFVNPLTCQTSFYNECTYIKLHKKEYFTLLLSNGSIVKGNVVDIDDIRKTFE